MLGPIVVECCRVVQHVAARCSVLQSVAAYLDTNSGRVIGLIITLIRRNQNSTQPLPIIKRVTKKTLKSRYLLKKASCFHLQISVFSHKRVLFNLTNRALYSDQTISRNENST